MEAMQYNHHGTKLILVLIIYFSVCKCDSFSFLETNTNKSSTNLKNESTEVIHTHKIQDNFSHSNILSEISATKPLLIATVTATRIGTSRLFHFSSNHTSNNINYQPTSSVAELANKVEATRSSEFTLSTPSVFPSLIFSSPASDEVDDGISSSEISSFLNLSIGDDETDLEKEEDIPEFKHMPESTEITTTELPDFSNELIQNQSEEKNLNEEESITEEPSDSLKTEFKSEEVTTEEPQNNSNEELPCPYPLVGDNSNLIEPQNPAEVEKELEEALRPTPVFQKERRKGRRRVRMRVRKIGGTVEGSLRDINSPKEFTTTRRYRSTTTPPPRNEARTSMRGVYEVTQEPQIERPLNTFTEKIRTYSITTPIPYEQTKNETGEWLHSSNSEHEPQHELQDEENKDDDVKKDIYSHERKQWEKNYMNLQQHSFYGPAPDLNKEEKKEEKVEIFINDNKDENTIYAIEEGSHELHDGKVKIIEITTERPHESEDEYFEYVPNLNKQSSSENAFVIPQTQIIPITLHDRTESYFGNSYPKTIQNPHYTPTIKYPHYVQNVLNVDSEHTFNEPSHNEITRSKNKLQDVSMNRPSFNPIPKLNTERNRNRDRKERPQESSPFTGFSHQELESTFLKNLFQSSQLNSNFGTHFPSPSFHEKKNDPLKSGDFSKAHESYRGSRNPIITLPMPGLVSIPTPPPEHTALKEVYSNRHYPPHTHSMSSKPDYEPANPPVPKGHPLQYHFDPFLQNANEYEGRDTGYTKSSRPKAKKHKKGGMSSSPGDDIAEYPPPLPRRQKNKQKKKNRGKGVRGTVDLAQEEHRHFNEEQNLFPPSNLLFREGESRESYQRQSPPGGKAEGIFSDNAYVLMFPSMVPPEAMMPPKPKINGKEIPVLSTSEPGFMEKVQSKALSPGYHSAKVHPREQMLQVLASNHYNIEMEKYMEKKRKPPVPIHTPYGLLVPMGSQTPHISSHHSLEGAYSLKKELNYEPALDLLALKLAKKLNGEEHEGYDEIVRHPPELLGVQVKNFHGSYSHHLPVVASAKTGRSMGQDKNLHEVLKERLREMLKEVEEKERKKEKVGMEMSGGHVYNNYLPPPTSPPVKNHGFMDMIKRFFSFGSWSKSESSQNQFNIRPNQSYSSPQYSVSKNIGLPSNILLKRGKFSSNHDDERNLFLNQARGGLANGNEGNHWLMEKLLRKLVNEERDYKNEKGVKYLFTPSPIPPPPFSPSISEEKSHWAPLLDRRKNEEDQVQEESKVLTHELIQKAYLDFVKAELLQQEINRKNKNKLYN